MASTTFGMTPRINAFTLLAAGGLMLVPFTSISRLEQINIS